MKQKQVARAVRSEKSAETVCQDPCPPAGEAMARPSKTHDAHGGGGGGGGGRKHDVMTTSLLRVNPEGGDQMN